jgi:hypothetical protein
MRYLIFIFAVGYLLAACKTSQRSGAMGTLVTCKDSAHLSGCRYLLQTEDGRYLLPLMMLDACPLVPEAQYRIQYDVLDHAVYACTSDALPIKMTTCRPVGPLVPEGTGGIKPGKALCAWTQDPYQIPWMEQVLAQTDADWVIRYVWMNAGAYYFQSRRGNFLFDCQGVLMCERDAGDDTCLSEFALEDRFVILVKNY